MKALGLRVKEEISDVRIGSVRRNSTVSNELEIFALERRIGKGKCTAAAAESWMCFGFLLARLHGV